MKFVLVKRFMNPTLDKHICNWTQWHAKPHKWLLFMWLTRHRWLENVWELAFLQNVENGQTDLFLVKLQLKSVIVQ